ncbi:type VI secretion system tube protein TssD [Pectobacterium versatile]|uniref:type VI secretion system tube protein TssD n=1 Tax=Pectobacterium versatile TaxID=2488639 RepID=UPI00102EE10D|nr:type VI secretion system tube protein TssD [Pectobacterium versatile]TAJ02176.1 type VI secretion system tube protein Hcp [Pectobacterium versatile]
MASIIYLKINGERQGLISAGASSVDSIGNKYQSGHEDEIFIYELMNQFTRLENVSFKFSSITLEHVIARTSSYMLWSDSIY